jgi:hypothetical protein
MKSPYLISLATASSVLAGKLTLAATENDPGVSDNEIKIGNTMPYSGPASAWGVIGKSEAAYFAMINDQGGVNGRKIKFVSRDDGYSPPKTIASWLKKIRCYCVRIAAQQSVVRAGGTKRNWPCGSMTCPTLVLASPTRPISWTSP